MFEDDYNPDEVIHASFTIVPGDSVDNTSLVWWKDGIEGTNQSWGISMYCGYQYNGPDIPISAQSARRILDNLSGSTPIEQFEWSEHDWVYVE